MVGVPVAVLDRYRLGGWTGRKLADVDFVTGKSGRIDQPKIREHVDEDFGFSEGIAAQTILKKLGSPPDRSDRIPAAKALGDDSQNFAG